MNYEEAKAKLLHDIEKYFFAGVEEVKIIHGIGTYTLRKMVLESIAEIDHAQIIQNKFVFNDPGSIRIRLLVPDEELLNSVKE